MSEAEQCNNRKINNRKNPNNDQCIIWVLYFVRLTILQSLWVSSHTRCVVTREKHQGNFFLWGQHGVLSLGIDIPTSLSLAKITCIDQYKSLHTSTNLYLMAYTKEVCHSGVFSTDFLSFFIEVSDPK